MGYALARAVTPSDSAQVNCQAFMVGANGNVNILCKSGETAITLACTVGIVYPIAAQLIRATNTTATGIVALYA